MNLGLIVKVSAKGINKLIRKIPGSFYDERCDCPSDLKTFYEDYNCPTSFDQLDLSMNVFEGICEIEIDQA